MLFANLVKFKNSNKTYVMRSFINKEGTKLGQVENFYESKIFQKFNIVPDTKLKAKLVLFIGIYEFLRQKPIKCIEFRFLCAALSNNHGNFSLLISLNC